MFTNWQILLFIIAALTNFAKDDRISIQAMLLFAKDMSSTNCIVRAVPWRGLHCSRTLNSNFLSLNAAVFTDNPQYRTFSTRKFPFKILNIVLLDHLSKNSSEQIHYFEVTVHKIIQQYIRIRRQLSTKCSDSNQTSRLDMRNWCVILYWFVDSAEYYRDDSLSKVVLHSRCESI